MNATRSNSPLYFHDPFYCTRHIIRWPLVARIVFLSILLAVYDLHYFLVDLVESNRLLSTCDLCSLFDAAYYFIRCELDHSANISVQSYHQHGAGVAQVVGKKVQ